MVSVSDNSEGKSDQLDVDEEIKRTLSAGAKTPLELKEAVIGTTGVSERVYYRHLKKLREKNIVEEVAEKTSTGDLIRKYALSRVPQEFTLGPQMYRAHLATFPKSLWELVAWVRHSPGGWSFDDKDVETACVIVPMCRFPVFFPKVKRYKLDPDRYVYDWPYVFKRDLKIGNPLPRFFSLKTIYQAKLTGAINELELKEAPSFLGIKEFVDNGGVKRQIAVVVCRRPDSKLQVFRVEFTPHSSEQWIDALCKEHDASCLQIIRSTDKDLVRRAVFHLDKVLQEKRLLIPSRYSLLLKDLSLFNFSYTPPPKPRNYDEELMLQDYMETAGNFVHALASSVSCADGLKRRTNNQSKMMLLMKRLKIWRFGGGTTKLTEKRV